MPFKHAFLFYFSMKFIKYIYRTCYAVNVKDGFFHPGNNRAVNPSRRDIDQRSPGYSMPFKLLAHVQIYFPSEFFRPVGIKSLEEKYFGIGMEMRRGDWSGVFRPHEKSTEKEAALNHIIIQHRDISFYCLISFLGFRTPYKILFERICHFYIPILSVICHSR